MRKPKVLVAMAVMLAMMLTSVGTASAAPYGDTPAGGPNTLAFAHADAHALDALTTATERRGLR